MYNPTEFLRAAIPAAIEAGKAIMEIYARPTEDWEVERKNDNSPLTLADRKANAIIVDRLQATGLPILSEEGAHAPYDSRKDWTELFVVDPLDGTKEFIKRNGEFTVNIAYVVKGDPVGGVIYVPATHTLYFGMKGFGAFKVGDVTVAKNDEVQLIRSAVRLPMETQRRNFVVVASRSHLSAETQAFIDALRKEHANVEILSAGSSLKICRVAEGSADVYPRLAPTMEWDTAAGDAIVRAAGMRVCDAATGKPLTYNKEDLHNPHFVVSK